MATLIIQTNASQLTDVTIRDMGIIIPNSGGSETFIDDVANFHSAASSSNLRTLITDNAFGANNSTILLFDGATAISQSVAVDFLNQLNNNTRVIQVTVDFGFPTGNEGDTATFTVNTTWASTSRRIVCLAFGGTTADHDPDDAIVEGIVAFSQNIVEGISFDVVSYAPQNSWGKYLINCTIS